MKLVNFCNRVIEYSFYALFFAVPLVFWKDTSELFELNKMWLTWAIAIIIAAAWISKMILQKKFSFRRTPLDIPIALFLLSQIISTIFSLDQHVSFWGYYSRFNGGLLSIFTYIFFYYAFITFVSEGVATKEGLPTARTVEGALAGGRLSTGPRFVKRLLSLSLVSGLIVALWGLPSHFGYDPTCFIFRGTFDVSCWRPDFLPTVRIFSTLGQPDWLAAYLVILIPIGIAYAISNWKLEIGNWKLWTYLSLATLFYLDLLFTRARSGFIGIWVALILFAVAYFVKEIRDNGQEISKNRPPVTCHLLLVPCLLLLVTFFVGTPVNQLRVFTLEGITQQIQKIQAPKTPVKSAVGGITDSGNIRFLVWTGAINAWKSSPIFGTGVETFAFDYYKYKPVGQNLTSEWNFLYNKAHNEYLNYLATTGLFGLATYLSMIITFFVLCIRYYVSSIKEKIHNTNYLILNTGLFASYVSILVTNFFGFSVVITNIYLFMLPAFVLVLTDMVKPKLSVQSANSSAEIETSIWQWTPLFFVLLACFWLLATLFRFWQADIAYAFGYNLDLVKEYQQTSYLSLHKAVELRGDESTFKDELAINDAIIASSLIAQKNQDNQAQVMSSAATLKQEAIDTSNEVVSEYPNNALFWKTRAKVFIYLSQIDSQYLTRAVDAIEKASLLAPNDANIWYYLGVLYGQSGNVDQGISALEKTILLKPDYKDAHYALGSSYHIAALDKSGKVVVDESLNKKAIDQMQYILKNINPKDADALKSLSAWAK